MSQIKVNSITNALEDGPVNFPYGLTGDGSKLTLAPQIISFSPSQLATGVGVGTNITLTFDQAIQFSGVGTIRIRQTSASGTIIESFTCGVSTRATISGSQLIIDPTSDLNFSTRYYVTLPSVGIANTLGSYYAGTESYFFNTADPQFTAQGGNYVYTLSNPASPTGYYKYHVFTATGVVTTTSSSVGSDLEFLMIGGGGSGGSPGSFGNGSGGGGAGGLISRTGPTLALSAGTYTITIGGGASPTPNTPSPGTQGTPSKLAPPSPTAPVILEAIGGGYGNNTSTPAAAGPGGSGGGYGTSSDRLGGGTGTPGQGNPGGNTNPGPTSANSSGGGGGAGGSGGTGSPFVSPPTVTNVPNGPGGSGSPVPAFPSSVLSGYIPVMPPTALTAIGPTGLYAGGGGGGSFAPGPTQVSQAGSGGPGGGGKGGQAPFAPASIAAAAAEPGQIYTGSGGGGGAPGTPTGTSGGGGSGVVMIRYATPAP